MAFPQVADADTRRAARNGHALWAGLVRSRLEAAATLAAPLADVLAVVGEEGLAIHVRMRAAVLADSVVR